MSNMNSYLLDKQDTVDKLIAQSQAVLICLTADDNLECLDSKIIGNSLWLLEDHLEKIKEQFTAYCEGVKA